MDKILEDLYTALRKQRITEAEFRTRHPEEYERFTEILKRYFATEENYMRNSINLAKSDDKTTDTK